MNDPRPDDDEKCEHGLTKAQRRRDGCSKCDKAALDADEKKREERRRRQRVEANAATFAPHFATIMRYDRDAERDVPYFTDSSDAVECAFDLAAAFENRARQYREIGE